MNRTNVLFIREGRTESGEGGTHKAKGCERDQEAHLHENGSSQIL